MSRVAFCWELGQGFGHLTPYLALIRRLIERGDAVYYLAKEVASARNVFKELPVEVIEFKPDFTPPAERIHAVDSYPEILHNCGFQDANVLFQRVNKLADAISKIGPDVLVVDFAPTAMVANVGLGLPIIAGGSGFQIPPRTTPMPRFRYWQGIADATLALNEDRVLAVINKVLARLGLATAESIAALLRTDGEWLTTFRELDCYGPRDGARYLGTFPPEQFGQAPAWPNEVGTRVFAYLSAGPAARTSLRALQDFGAAVCLVGYDLKPGEKEDFDPSQVQMIDTLVDVTSASREAALVVHNGNLNTTAASLLCGTPQLAIPTTAERYLNARRLELLGAGLAAPQEKPGDIPAKIRALITERQYTRAALHFSENYRAHWQADHTQTMIEDIDRLVG